MKEELKLRWIEALNSGEYQQAKDVLTSSEGKCCLGVLADVASNRTCWEEGIMQRHLGAGNEDLPPEYVTDYGMLDSTGTFKWDNLPEDLQVELEAIASKYRLTFIISSGGEKIPNTGGLTPFSTVLMTSLATLNDSGVPFELIAKVIAAKPEGLFVAD